MAWRQQGGLLLTGGAKGKGLALPSARIMITSEVVAQGRPSISKSRPGGNPLPQGHLEQPDGLLNHTGQPLAKIAEDTIAITFFLHLESRPPTA